MTAASRVVITELDHEQQVGLLERNHVGRLAWLRDSRITVEPISYCYRNGWIHGRTSMGEKLQALSNNAYNWWPVAFEVDEVENAFTWRSVVVHGGFQVVEKGSAEWNRSLELLRSVSPAIMTAEDPAPFRDVLFRISAADMTGRASRL